MPSNGPMRGSCVKRKGSRMTAILDPTTGTRAAPAPVQLTMEEQLAAIRIEICEEHGFTVAAVDAFFGLVEQAVAASGDVIDVESADPAWEVLEATIPQKRASQPGTRHAQLEQIYGLPEGQTLWHDYDSGCNFGVRAVSRN
jgi:hypothetical protein